MEEIQVKVNKEEEKVVENLAKEVKAEDEVQANKRIEESLNYDLLTDEEKEAIDTFLSKIDVNDTTQVIQYGAKAQAKISKFSDSVLEGVKTRSTGEVGDLLANLVGQIKSFDSDIAMENKSGLAKLFYNAKRQLDTITAKYSKIETNIDSIEKQLENHKLQM